MLRLRPVSYLLLVRTTAPHRTFATMSGPPAKRLKVETDDRTTALEPIMKAGQQSKLADVSAPTLTFLQKAPQTEDPIMRMDLNRPDSPAAPLITTRR